MKKLIIFILIPTFLFGSYVVDDGVHIRDYGSITNYANAMQQVDKTNTKLLRQYEMMTTIQSNVITIQGNIIVEQKKQIKVMHKTFMYSIGVFLVYIISFTFGYITSKK